MIHVSLIKKYMLHLCKKYMFYLYKKYKFHLYKKATNETEPQHKMDPQIMFNLGIHFKGPFLL